MTARQRAASARVLAEQQVRRLLPVFFEVHFWPHEGRVLVVDKQAHRAAPALTFIELTGSSEALHDATAATAYRLAGAVAFDVPGACAVLHDRHGNMLATPAGLALPVTALRRAA